MFQKDVGSSNRRILFTIILLAVLDIFLSTFLPLCVWFLVTSQSSMLRDIGFNLFAANCIFLFLAFTNAIASRYWKLRNVPGPWICSFTDLYRAYIQNSGELANWLAKIHQQYGTVVRIGPNTVSISDPRAVPLIYTMHGEFRKVRGSASLLAHWKLIRTSCIGRFIPHSPCLLQRCKQRKHPRSPRRSYRQCH